MLHDINLQILRHWSQNDIVVMRHNVEMFTSKTWSPGFIFPIVAAKCSTPKHPAPPNLSLPVFPPSQFAVMPRFAEQVEVAIEALSTNPPQPFEENEFIDASRLVYDGVRDIRKAVLMIRVRSPSLCRSIGATRARRTKRGAFAACFPPTADGGNASLTFHEISPLLPDPPCKHFFSPPALLWSQTLPLADAYCPVSLCSFFFSENWALS